LLLNLVASGFQTFKLLNLVALALHTPGFQTSDLKLIFICLAVDKQQKKG